MWHSAEATKVSLLVLSKESDVSYFEFLSLLGIVVSPLSGVFANALQVVEHDHGEVTQSAIKLAGLWRQPELDEEFRNVRLHGELLGGRGISLSETIEHLLQTW